ncbi:MAG: CvpA family protein [Bacteroidales bacterium]|nr:CvpA family protein [Bacteroidales bacterium]
MNYIDIIFIVPLIWFAYRGFSKGLIIEVTSLIALILGIYFGIYFSNYAADFLTGNFNINQRYIPVISFAVTFIIIVIVVFIIGRILEKFINLIALGFFNKVAGAFFGILKAAVILSIILFIINRFDDKFISKEKQDASFLYKPILKIAPIILFNIDEFDFSKPSFKKPKKADEKFL